MLDVVVVWLQRDLRLHDNPALTAALLTARRVVLTFVWAPEEEGQFQPGRASRWWLYNSLTALEKQVQGKGARICYRRGPCVVNELLDVCQESQASAVFFNNVYDPLSLVRDHEVKRRLHAAGILARSFTAELLYEPSDVLDSQGRPFTTFEGFWNKAMTGMPHPPPEPMFAEPVSLPSVPKPEIYRLRLDDLRLESQEELAANVHLKQKWTPGTAFGLKLLVNFLEHRLEHFDHDRAKIDRESTSRLSPHIHFGEISIRVIYHEARKRDQQIQQAHPGSTAVCDFVKQLGYREYSRYLSFHFPFTHERSLLEHVRAVPWVQCPMRFKAWRQGMTGFPIVDAAMRELWATGWMHNRARVFTASFLVKNLLLPWQWGLKHFWDMLLDADLECDALGWQYVAGCLQDAHPFNYMLDIKQESKRFDPDGHYIRRWVTGLAKLPAEYIHEPWHAPAAVLEAADVRLGEDYPCPIVTVHESRAALDHAYGVIQKCVSSRGFRLEPYRVPTIPVEMSLLEPEEEVEQMVATDAPPAATASLGTATSNSGASMTMPAVLRQPAPRAPLESRLPLRKEQYPPGLVLPDISMFVNEALVHMDQAGQQFSCGSTGPAAHAASCNPSAVSHDGRRAAPAASGTASAVVGDAGRQFACTHAWPGQDRQPCDVAPAHGGFDWSRQPVACCAPFPPTAAGHQPAAGGCVAGTPNGSGSEQRLYWSDGQASVEGRRGVGGAHDGSLAGAGVFGPFSGTSLDSRGRGDGSVPSQKPCTPFRDEAGFIIGGAATVATGACSPLQPEVARRAPSTRKAHDHCAEDERLRKRHSAQLPSCP